MDHLRPLTQADLNEIGALSSEIFRWMCYVEAFNHRCVEILRKSPSQTSSTSPEEILKSLDQAAYDRARQSSFLLKETADGTIPSDLRPALETALSRVGSTTLVAPTRHPHTLWVYEIGEKYAVHGVDTQRPAFGVASVKLPEQPEVRRLLGTLAPTSALWPKHVDPTWAAKEYLVSQRGLTQDTVPHYLQASFRRHFELRYEERISQILPNVCRRYNALFCDESGRARDCFMSTQILVADIQHEIDRRIPGVEKSQRIALALYWFIRICQQLRPSYHWLVPAGKKAGVNADPADHEIDPSADTPEGEWLRSPHQCIESSRPLEYGYFKARVFGALSGLGGVNYIFKGGILPASRTGRTWRIRGGPGTGKTALALSLLADMASRGRVGVYVSFEEPYETIQARLNDLGLYDPLAARFLVCEMRQSDLKSDVQDAFKRKGTKGVLFLYKAKFDEAKKLSDVLKDINDTIVETANETWPAQAGEAPEKHDERSGTKWRAVALDSLEALYADSLDASETNPSTEEVRKALRELVRNIRDLEIWALLITEGHENDALESLGYLTSCNVELSIDHEQSNRWFEISKCREQDYQHGRHQMRISEQRGIRLYPSVSAMRSTLRRLPIRPLSAENELRLWQTATSGDRNRRRLRVRERGCTLILGRSRVENLKIALLCATKPFVKVRRSLSNAGAGSPPPHVLVVTLTRPQRRLEELVAQDQVLKELWDTTRNKDIRYFSPGDRYTANQFVWDIDTRIRTAKRNGSPINRIVFDGVDLLSDLLPSVAARKLFWPTLHELAMTEGMTSFFVAGGDAKNPEVRIFDAIADYVVEVVKPRNAKTSTVRVIKASERMA